MLIGVRFAMGLSQRELAAKLAVHKWQVSRDERNEYYGVSPSSARLVFPMAWASRSPLG